MRHVIIPVNLKNQIFTDMHAPGHIYIHVCHGHFGQLTRTCNLRNAKSPSCSEGVGLVPQDIAWGICATHIVTTAVLAIVSTLYELCKGYNSRFCMQCFVYNCFQRGLYWDRLGHI